MKNESAEIFRNHVANCERIIAQAKELKALLSLEDPKMIDLNKSRAVSGIDTMKDALAELKDFIGGPTPKPEELTVPRLFSKEPVCTRSLMFQMPPYGKLEEDVTIYVEYWQQSDAEILSYRVFAQPKWEATRFFIASAICRCPVLYELNQADAEAEAIVLDILQNKLILDDIQVWYKKMNY